MGTVQIFISQPRILGRIEDPASSSRICPWSKVKLCRIKEDNFSKECTCLRHCESAIKLFLLDFCREYRHSQIYCKFYSSFCCGLRVD